MIKKEFQSSTLLTIIVLFFFVMAIQYLSLEKIASYGSFAGGLGSILAVIWFFSALKYQSMQLSEQSEQFAKALNLSNLEAKRQSLTMAKQILSDAETEAKTILSIEDLSAITTQYLMSPEIKILLESQDVNEVINYSKVWLKKEGSAKALLGGIKHAARIILENQVALSVDYSKSPEEFIIIYGCLFWKEPYFDRLQSVAEMLSQFLFLLKPGRESCILAATVAAALIAPENTMNHAAINKSIKEHKEKKYPMPAIVEKYQNKKK